ncbi:MAG: ribbon-helix-helix domain-containing protein [Promethearchaeota archaeon]
MKMITVHIPVRYLDALEDLVDKGHFPSRSEAIRVAIRDLIRNEMALQNTKDSKEN